MTSCETNHSEQGAIEVIRDELRHEATNQRKNHRLNELVKRRAALGEIPNIEKSWDRDKVVTKAQELKKKPLPINEYLQLQNALIQDEDNIDGLFSVHNIISALIRDFSSSNPAVQLVAAHCCCNIALGNETRCRTLCKYIGPYLVEQLDTLNYPLLEACVWTIGNLCSGSKNAFKALMSQGCLHHLLSLLRDSDKKILPSIIYAVTHYLYRGSELMSDDESVEMAKILINRDCYNSSDGLWILALLSSKSACTPILLVILPSVIDVLVTEINQECPDIKYLTAAIRILGNMISESSGCVADMVFANTKFSAQEIFDNLLSQSHIHIRKETLWLIGNLYNHSQSRVNQTIKSFLPHLQNFNYAVQSIAC